MAGIYEHPETGEWVPVERPAHTLKELRDRAVLHALAYTDGNVKKAARLLGTSSRMVIYYLKQMGFRARPMKPYARRCHRSK